MTKNNRFYAAAALLLALAFSSCASMRTSGYNTRDIIVRYARNMMDKNYAYGENDPSKGFDCSGLVMYAYKEAGISIPRTSAAQYKKARKIQLSKAKEGDLVFFSTYAEGPTHVGIYLGNGRFIHSPSEGKKVQMVDMENSYWKKSYYGAGCLLPE